MNSFTTRILGQTAGGELLFYSQLKTHHSKLVSGYFPPPVDNHTGIMLSYAIMIIKTFSLVLIVTYSSH